jgi:hypothetical protein
MRALRWARRAAAVLLLAAMVLPLSRCSHQVDASNAPDASDGSGSSRLSTTTYSYAWSDFDAGSPGSWLIFLAFLWPIPFVIREALPGRRSPAWLLAVQLLPAAGAALLVFYRTFLDELWVGGYLAYIALGCYAATLLAGIGVAIARKAPRKRSGP